LECNRFARARLISSIETIEYVRLIRLRDAGSCVCDFDAPRFQGETDDRWPGDGTDGQRMTDSVICDPAGVPHFG